MRRGIGLRGYAQQDPLNEFKREAFQLYDELRGLIRHGVASSIFRVTVTRQPATAARRGSGRRRALARGAPALAGGNGANGSRRSRDGVGAAAAARAGRCGGRRLGDPARRPAAAPDRPADARIARRRAGRPGRRIGRSVGAGGPKPGFTPSGARIGRNDPCWCGSGAKYKKCHGR